MKKTELLGIVQKKLEIVNGVRTTVKDLGRSTQAKHTIMLFKKKVKHEDLRIIHVWLNSIMPYTEIVQNVWKLLPSKVWEMYYLMGGCDSLREMKMLRLAIKDFLRLIAKRPPQIRIDIPKAEEEEDDATTESELAD